MAAADDFIHGDGDGAFALLELAGQALRQQAVQDGIARGDIEFGHGALQRRQLLVAARQCRLPLRHREHLGRIDARAGGHRRLGHDDGIERDRRRGGRRGRRRGHGAGRRAGRYGRQPPRDKGQHQARHQQHPCDDLAQTAHGVPCDICTTACERKRAGIQFVPMPGNEVIRPCKVASKGQDCVS
ncbi:hypothetical protein D9M68_745040 [compost metagenome]